MRVLICLFLITVAGLVISAPAEDRPTKPPESFDVDRIDSYLASEVLKRGRVGLSVAVVKDGKLVLAKGYGKASIEPGGQVDSDTLFAIGSVTKQFTCACVLLLAQEGKLSVNDKVSKYFPRLTRAGTTSVLDLMNHTSGYPDYYPLDFVDRRMQAPIIADDLISQYASGKLDFEPGSAWSYSNTGFIILGRIVEKVSGQSFADFLSKRILKPLGMYHTAYEPDPKDKRLAAGYASFALSGPEAAMPEAKGWAGAAGAIYSTPSDLAKWDLALIDGNVLKPRYYKIMTTPREVSPGKTTGYGCGLSIGIQEGRTVLRHSGAVSGFNAFNAMVPSMKSAVVVFSNMEDGLGSLPDTLLGLLLKEDSKVPKVNGPSVVEVVKTVFAQFQAANIDRAGLGKEFSHFLTDEKVAAASSRLKDLGAPKNVEVLRTRERGGMEVTTTRLAFASRSLQVLMYRMPNGEIEQFFISEP